MQEVISGLQDKMREAADLVSGIGKGSLYLKAMIIDIVMFLFSSTPPAPSVGSVQCGSEYLAFGPSQALLCTQRPTAL